MNILKVWRREQSLAIYQDPVMAKVVVEEKDQASGEGWTRMEVVKDALHRQYREHS